MHHMSLLNVLKKFTGLLAVNVTDKPVEVETCLPNASIPRGHEYDGSHYDSEEKDHRVRRLNEELLRPAGLRIAAFPADDAIRSAASITLAPRSLSGLLPPIERWARDLEKS